MKLATILRQMSQHLKFVPQSKPINPQDVQTIQRFFDSSSHMIVITGAGLSTESGIPDYRSEGVGLYARSNHRPMTYQDFIKSASNRQRYWARNFVGWPTFASFEPNMSHHMLADLEQCGKVHWLVTQNVDALHTKAGSEKITELHGCSHRVVCLNCPSQLTRWDLQKSFNELNPNFDVATIEMAPDGDVIIPDDMVQMFKVPPCPSCGGVLKPDVTFFGDNVPRHTVEMVFDKVAESDRMLVAGSSLYVYSSYRFVRRAHDLGIPIAVINIGETRADKFVDLKISARCGDILTKLNWS